MEREENLEKRLALLAALGASMIMITTIIADDDDDDSEEDGTDDEPELRSRGSVAGRFMVYIGPIKVPYTVYIRSI